MHEGELGGPLYRRSEVVAVPVVAGTDDGELVSGGRSSANDGLGDAGR